MMDPKDIQKRNAALCRLAGKKFSFEEESLRRAMRKVGRRMPRAAHKHAAILTEAEQMAGHPKLRMRIDADRVNAAYEALDRMLTAVDPADRRKGAILGMLGGLSFNLVALFVLMIILLKWRGYL